MNEFFISLFDLSDMSVLQDGVTHDYIQSLRESINQPAVICGLVFILLPILASIFFYTRLDNPKYAKISKWATALFVVFLTVLMFTTFYCYREISIDFAEIGDNYPYPPTYPLTIGGIAGLYSVVIFFISSIVAKNFSTSQKNNPF